MTLSGSFLLVLLLTGALLLVLAILTYNRLIRLKQRVDGAWADIDAQLKRRHDLVPSLVETVKGYASHERQTLEEVVARRGAAVQAGDHRAGSSAVARVDSENELVRSLRGLFALAESYPDLRASDRFGKLQDQLSDIEDHLQNARRYYNAVVRDFNIAQAKFPDLVVARSLGFNEREFFELDSPLERRSVRVRLDDEEA